MRSALVISAVVAVLGTPLVPRTGGAATADTTEPVFLKPGEVVAPFEAQGIDGTMHTINYPKGTTTILLFFSSGCPHCHQMIPEWNRRFQSRSSNLAVVGVIVDKPPDVFFEKVSILFPVLRSPGPRLLDAFKVARVPITLRVASGGKVEEVGVGKLDGITLGEIFRP